MYYRGKSKEETSKNIPFEVICTNCGSNNVDVMAFEHWDLEIKCRSCGSRLDYGCYNPTKYEA